MRRVPTSPLFPYTTLFRSAQTVDPALREQMHCRIVDGLEADDYEHARLAAETMLFLRLRKIDRKSTRLNSSHQIISYAVFCLKKKRRSSAHSTRLTQYCSS